MLQQQSVGKRNALSVFLFFFFFSFFFWMNRVLPDWSILLYVDLSSFHLLHKGRLLSRMETSDPLCPGLEDLEAAAERLRGHCVRTPLIPFHRLNGEHNDTKVLLKHVQLLLPSIVSGCKGWYQRNSRYINTLPAFSIYKSLNNKVAPPPWCMELIHQPITYRWGVWEHYAPWRRALLETLPPGTRQYYRLMDKFHTLWGATLLFRDW